MIIWDRTTTYIFNLNRVKDTQRLYQNELILHLVKENQDFYIKINVIYFK